MIIVAHPDDELLGLGATMNKLINDYQVLTHVVILGEGITSRSINRDINLWKNALNTHRENIRTAQTAIGYQNVSIYNFPDNRFDSVALLDIIKVIEKEKLDFKPNVIFTHNGSDLNVDHKRTFEAVMTACRPVKEEPVNTIITFETPSSTEWSASTDSNHFIPNLYFEVSFENVQAKIKGMETYEFEKREYPHPRSPEALKIQAQRCGIAIGCNFAEAFCLVRGIYLCKDL